MAAISRLLQFTDSTFPVGTFSFSNGLETAAFENIVTDAASLHDFVKSQALQAAYSDGVAAIHAFRAFKDNDYEKIVEADKMLMLFKMNDEARLMLKRMGKKFAELSKKLFYNPLISRWLEDIKAERTPGSFPIAQGISYAAAGVTEADLFCAHQYGVINMVLSAALRCVKVSHYDTQKILFELSDNVESLYNEASQMELKDMNAFFPQLDILASLHEKGAMRMFMN
ncbi:MAG: urease accessory protein UreF [Muribaculaceae bacterium]|nr:urease accessory protein UreF [Muribaculaceae bacterium]